MIKSQIDRKRILLIAALRGGPYVYAREAGKISARSPVPRAHSNERRIGRW